MPKPTFTARIFWLGILLGAALVLAACATTATVAPTFTSVPATPSQTAFPVTATLAPQVTIPQKSVTKTPQWVSALTPIPTQTQATETTSGIAWSTTITDVVAYYLKYGFTSLSWPSDAFFEINGDYFDARTGAIQMPPRAYKNSATQQYSPDKKYSLNCGRDAVRLYQGEQLLGEAAFGALCWDARWRADSQAVSILGSDRQSDGLYIWWVFKSKPTKIANGPTGPGSWSPDGQRLVYAYCERLGFDEQAYAEIVSVNSWQRVTRIEVSGCGVTWGAVVSWLSNDVLVEPLRYGWMLTVYEYYNVMAGKKLGYHFDSADFPNQQPVLSPDGRWHIRDLSEPVWDQTGVMNMSNIYTMYDLQDKDGYVLSNSPTKSIQFLEWAVDGSTFYLISRPMTNTARTSPEFPFGLLALDPATRQFTQLFDQAVFARLSPDKQLAWVVFPAKREDGALGLEGGIFNLADKTLVGRQFVSDHLLYANPAEGDLAPMVWSNDGARLVFGDSHGMLSLLNVDGTAQTLASGLPHDDETWPKNVHYAWSPDDQHLLVQYGAKVWIADVREK